MAAVILPTSLKDINPALVEIWMKLLNVNPKLTCDIKGTYLQAWKMNNLGTPMSCLHLSLLKFSRNRSTLNSRPSLV